MFGPREVLLTSENPVITQFVNGRRFGPIGMSEEKDEATLAAEKASLGTATAWTPRSRSCRSSCRARALPERQAVRRHTDRVMAMLPTLPPAAQRAILAELGTGQPGGTVPAPGDPQGREREQAQLQARAEAWRLAREREAAQREAAAQRGGADAAEADQAGEGPGSWPADWPGGTG